MLITGQSLNLILIASVSVQHIVPPSTNPDLATIITRYPHHLRPMATSSNPSLYLPVAMFCCAIKKDPSLFPVLKDDKYHDVWHRSFKTQAVAQDASKLLDETYVPKTADDIALLL